MSSGNADVVGQAGEQEEFDQIEAPPGVIEAIELYEAVIPHYVAAAARLDSISRISSTSAALAASFPGSCAIRARGAGTA